MGVRNSRKTLAVEFLYYNTLFRQQSELWRKLTKDTSSVNDRSRGLEYIGMVEPGQRLGRDWLRVVLGSWEYPTRDSVPRENPCYRENGGTRPEGASCVRTEVGREANPHNDDKHTQSSHRHCLRLWGSVTRGSVQVSATQRPSWFCTPVYRLHMFSRITPGPLYTSHPVV